MKKFLKTNKKSFWLYGKHTCISALKNKNRRCLKLLMTHNFYKRNKKEIDQYINKKNVEAELIRNKVLDNTLPIYVNHQGIALKVLPIFQNLNIENIANSNNNSTLVILDQITDINNIGSILRTSVCFNVDAIVLPCNHSPNENASIAKVASGALDMIPLIRVTNIVKTMKYLKKLGYWCYGFDNSTTKKYINEINNFEKKIAIIFGSEEKGMRQLVKKSCDYLVKIPISNTINSLNISNAVAIGLFYIYQSIIKT